MTTLPRGSQGNPGSPGTPGHQSKPGMRGLLGTPANNGTYLHVHTYMYIHAYTVLYIYMFRTDAQKLTGYATGQPDTQPEYFIPDGVTNTHQRITSLREMWYNYSLFVEWYEGSLIIYNHIHIWIMQVIRIRKQHHFPNNAFAWDKKS